jgi:ribonuclease D
MASNLEADRKADPPHYLRSNYVRRMGVAIAAARETPAKDYPSKRVRGNGPRLDIDESQFGRIRAKRDAVAKELKLEPTIIATRGNMEMLAAKNIDKNNRDGILLNWQKEVLGDVAN